MDILGRETFDICISVQYTGYEDDVSLIMAT